MFALIGMSNHLLKNNRKDPILLTTGSWELHPAAHHRSIPTLYLSSPPSGCNPDSDSSPLSLSPGKEVMARSESTWLGILTPIQVNVPYDRLLSCLAP